MNVFDESSVREEEVKETQNNDEKQEEGETPKVPKILNRNVDRIDVRNKRDQWDSKGGWDGKDQRKELRKNNEEDVKA